MELTEKAIGLEQIQVNSPYGLIQLSDFQMVSRPNRHTQVFFSGLLADTQKDTCIERATDQDRIEVNLTENGKKVRTLFKGVATNLSVKHVRGVYYLEAEALSATYLMDIKLKNRSFQNQQMSYQTFFQTVLADYPKASYIDRVTQGAKLQEILIQSQETDWALLVRAASRLGAVLIPDSTSEYPRFWLGIPEGKAHQMVNFHYSLGKNLAQYRNSSQNYDAKLPEIDFAGYRVESNELLNLGELVEFQGINLVIAEVSSGFKQGVLKSEYLLTTRDGLRQNKIINQQLAGTSLRGKVIDRRRDQVRLHLAIDQHQNKEEAYWFKVAPSYAAEGHSGWYCISELGDELQLYFENGCEESGVVIGSLRRDGATNPKTAEPAIKYFGNTHGKELRLDDRQLQFSAKEHTDGKMWIKLDTETGVEIQSDQMIRVESGDDLVWDGKTISLAAEHGVFLACKQSSLIVDGKIDIKAEMVRVEGLVQGQGDGTQQDKTDPDQDREADSESDHDAEQEENWYEG